MIEHANTKNEGTGGPSALNSGSCCTDPRRFIAIASKPHAQLAGEMANEIKAVIYRHEQQIPLALAIGVLRIVEKEILDAANVKVTGEPALSASPRGLPGSAA